MEILKKPLWRVPAVLGCTGILCRLLTYILAFIWTRIQIARGPGPDGAFLVGSGGVTVVVSVISFLLFWLAGWQYVRGLSRRQIFLSASIMVLLNGALLAWEQLSQAIGGYSLWVYRLYALTEGQLWVSQLLFRLFDAVSVPLAIPGIFAPYLYLLFGCRDASDRC